MQRERDKRDYAFPLSLCIASLSMPSIHECREREGKRQRENGEGARERGGKGRVGGKGGGGGTM